MDYFQQRLFQLENDKTNVNLKENEKYSNGYSFRGAIPRDKSEHQQQTLHSKNELELSFFIVFLPLLTLAQKALSYNRIVKIITTIKVNLTFRIRGKAL